MSGLAGCFLCVARCMVMKDRCKEAALRLGQAVNARLSVRPKTFLLIPGGTFFVLSLLFWFSLHSVGLLSFGVWLMFLSILFLGMAPFALSLQGNGEQKGSQARVADVNNIAMNLSGLTAESKPDEEAPAAEETATTPNPAGEDDVTLDTRLDVPLAISMAALTFLGLLAFFAYCGLTQPIWPEYQADQVLAALCALAFTVFSFLFTLAVLAEGLPPSEGPIKWARRCCCCCGFPFLIILCFLAMWSTLCEPEYLEAYPGLRVETPGNPTIHVHCSTDYDAALPTVVFLHGWTGSGNDAEWVRRHPDFLATKLRFCSLDRPGYGWSDPYPAGNEHKHFGFVAKVTEAVLRKQGVRGDVIMLFHSLGGYHTMAFLHHVKEVSEFKDIRILGGVAVDAMAPDWLQHDVPRPAASCSPAAPFEGGPLWPTFRILSATGVVRILYSSGFGGFNIAVLMYPADLTDKVSAYSMRRIFYDSVIVEDQRWSINCGYAIRGQAAMADLLALEVISLPGGLDMANFALMNNRSRLIVTPGPPEAQHSGIMLHHDYAPILVDSLVRVINTTLRFREN